MNKMKQNDFIKYKEEYDNKYYDELEKTGIFYAFGNEQWEENKTHKDAPDSEYLSVMAGGYIHKSNEKKLDNFLNNVVPQLKKDFISNINIEDLISYELSNYECYYTGDYMEIVPIICEYLESDMSERNDVVEMIEIVYTKTLKDCDDF